MCIRRALGSARTLRHLRYRIDFVSLSRVKQEGETCCRAGGLRVDAEPLPRSSLYVKWTDFMNRTLSMCFFSIPLIWWKSFQIFENLLDRIFLQRFHLRSYSQGFRNQKFSVIDFTKHATLKRMLTFSCWLATNRVTTVTHAGSLLYHGRGRYSLSHTISVAS